MKETKIQINERERVLGLLRLKCFCRIRGLEVDIKSGYKFEGRLQEYKELLSHLDELRWIVADIECAKKYLSEEEKILFKKLKQGYLKEEWKKKQKK